MFSLKPSYIDIPFGSLLASACATFPFSSAPSFWQLDGWTTKQSTPASADSLNQHYDQQIRIHEHCSTLVQNRQDRFIRDLCAMLQMLLTTVEQTSPNPKNMARPIPGFLHCSKLPPGFTSSEKQFTFPINSIVLSGPTKKLLESP